MLKKEKLVYNIKGRQYLFIALVLYTVLATYFFHFYRYRIAPDTISYISIAQKYLSGNFSLAVNGCWNPLFSWLMVPFLAMGVDPLIAGNLVILTAGALTVWGVSLLSSKLRIKSKIRIIIVISSVPLILSFVFRFLSPDLLTICTLTFYLVFAMNNNYTKKRSAALWAGFLGALAYFSKTYNFFFFLAHFTLFNIILYFVKSSLPYKKKNVIKSYFTGIIIFSLISGGWIILISQKYNKFTIGTSGKYVYSIVGPHSKGHPTHFLGFIPPPDEQAVSAWDDPSYFRVKSWSPFSSKENFKHQIEIIKKNINTQLTYFSISACLIILAFFFILKSNRNGHIKDVKELFILSAVVIYPSGYLLVSVKQRYIWFISILIMLVGGYIITKLFRYKCIKNSVKIMLLLGFMLSILYSSVRFFHNPHYKYQGKGVYKLSNILKKYKINGKLASSKRSWPTALYLAYHLKCKYYGEIRPKAETNENLLRKDLLKFNIDYFITLKKENYKFLKDYQELTEKEQCGVKVYALKR